VLLPQARGEEMDLEGGMGINTLEHVHEITIGIDALQPTRDEQTLNDTDVVGVWQRFLHFRATADKTGKLLTLQRLGNVADLSEIDQMRRRRKLATELPIQF